MKTLIRFLSVLLCVAPFSVADAVVSTTAGNNLTAYNGEAGAINNNRWNTLMNSRTGGSGTVATADFGNCNAVVMRCAQPKCANGGCVDMDVTFAIVSGCVQSNSACVQYGDELTQYIAAQLVAQSTAKANNAANAAQTAAANAAAAQNAQQMAVMQQQMQQMQSEMAAQNAQQLAQLQNALAEQKQLTADAIAQANAAREASATQNNTTTKTTTDLTNAQLSAAERGVSSDILAREQITGQILSAIENAEVSLKNLKATMQDTFEYAGCDSRGDNCSGPKRVKTFKQKAEGFFDPYENVLDELYDALILAQSVGVDITDIYMMLNGSCNIWGQYLCSMGSALTKTECIKGKDGNETCTTTTTDVAKPETYNGDTCVNNKSRSYTGKYVRGGHECSVNSVVPPEDDTRCTLNKTLVDDKNNPVQRDWLWGESNTESGAIIRVGCASSALTSSALFRNRKKQATIDVETLQRIINQDAPTTSRSKYDGENEYLKYCAVTEGMYADLQKLVTMRALPTSGVCINETTLNKNLDTTYLANEDSIIELARANCDNNVKGKFSEYLHRCYCEKDKDEKGNVKDGCNEKKSETAMHTAEKMVCERYGGAWGTDNKCVCSDIKDDTDKKLCEMKFGKQQKEDEDKE